MEFFFVAVGLVSKVRFRKYGEENGDGRHWSSGDCRLPDVKEGHKY
jgi:hypothetical protein